MRLFRVIIPVSNIEHAKSFYESLLKLPALHASAGRRYFNCGGTILACYDPRADGDPWDAQPNPDHVYLSVDDLDEVHERARQLDGSTVPGSISKRPWGELSFYMTDPFGNKLCFVQKGTEFTGSSTPRKI